MFPRARDPLLHWLRQLSGWSELRWVVPAHYAAPIATSAQQLSQLADAIEQRPWAVNEGNWAYLASLDQLLLRLGVVPQQPGP